MTSQQITNCIDLKERFGDRYRVVHGESYEAERGNNGRAHASWLQVVPCRYGHIYPRGGELLGTSTDHRGPVANRLAALPSVRVVQLGDDEINAVFHFSSFDDVAAVMKPKRRRMLTPDQRAERVERLRKYQFSSAIHNARSDRRRDETLVLDSQAV
jgi:hypothetical protein